MLELNIVAKTTLLEIPCSCAKCAFGKTYGMVGDVKCRILDKYFTGNTKPPNKERPDECPLVDWNTRAEPEPRVLAELKKWLRLKTNTPDNRIAVRGGANYFTESDRIKRFEVKAGAYQDVLDYLDKQTKGE